MRIKIGKIRGSSIIEVIVAFTIISISISLTGVLFAKVFDSSRRMKVQKAWFTVSEIASTIKLNGTIPEVINDRDAFDINIVTKEVAVEHELWQVSIYAYEKLNLKDNISDDVENSYILASYRLLVKLNNQE